MSIAMDVQPLSPEVIQDTSSSSIEARSVPPDAISTTFSTDSYDLLSPRLGTHVLGASDQFFCPATNLTTPTAPIHKPNTFTPQGAWYDGWETRRHNPQPADWVVWRLGVPARAVKGVEVDTGFFSGNHAPAVSVEGFCADNDDAAVDALVLDPTFAGWSPILPSSPCGPACRQAWLVASPTAPQRYTHIRLRMYPDGGIGRVRLYGVASATAGPRGAVRDLAALSGGGLAVSSSDSHFSPASNLLLPGRGTDMSDGWETRRSRGAGHVDWVVVRLGGAGGAVERVVVDTAFYRGNFPRSVRVDVAAGEEVPDGAEDLEGSGGGRWVAAGKEIRCAADKEHVFAREGVRDGEVVCGDVEARWARMVIIPDGGVKRLRVFCKCA